MTIKEQVKYWIDLAEQDLPVIDKFVREKTLYVEFVH